MLSMLKVLPLMKKRKDGIIINVASRAGSKDFSNNLAYCVSKAAVIRATGCIQLQLDAEGLGDYIQLYALHPGGVLTDMQTGNTSPNYLCSLTSADRCGCPESIPPHGRGESFNTSTYQGDQVSSCCYVLVYRKWKGKDSQRSIF